MAVTFVCITCGGPLDVCGSCKPRTDLDRAARDWVQAQYEVDEVLNWDTWTMADYWDFVAEYHVDGRGARSFG